MLQLAYNRDAADPVASHVANKLHWCVCHVAVAPLWPRLSIWRTQLKTESCHVSCCTAHCVFSVYLALHPSCSKTLRKQTSCSNRTVLYCIITAESQLSLMPCGLAYVNLLDGSMVTWPHTHSFSFLELYQGHILCSSLITQSLSKLQDKFTDAVINVNGDMPWRVWNETAFGWDMCSITQWKLYWAPMNKNLNIWP